MNAISGVSTGTHSIEPPMFGAEQDYVVVGKQPWLDGIFSGPRVVRQVNKFLCIKDVPLFERFKSLLQPILAQDIQLKNKLLGKAELAGLSSIFSLVAQRLMGSFFLGGKEVESISPPSELGIVGDQLVLEG